MKLRKTSESVNRSFNAEGNPSERINDVQYEILNADGNVIGNANIGNGYANASISLSGFSTIAEGEEQVRAFLSGTDSGKQE